MANSDLLQIPISVMPVVEASLTLSFLYPGPALSQCNRCNCIGSRASGGPVSWCL